MGIGAVNTSLYAGKETEDLASHWRCVTDNSGLPASATVYVTKMSATPILLLEYATPLPLIWRPSAMLNLKIYTFGHVTVNLHLHIKFHQNLMIFR